MLSTEHNSIEHTVEEWANGRTTTRVYIGGGTLKITQVFDGTLGQVLVFGPDELPRLIKTLVAADQALRDAKDAAEYHASCVEAPFLSPHCASGY